MIGNIGIDVLRKDIKNLHLSVHPPTGRVRISAPKHMKLDTIRVFAVSKVGWIKKHQTKIRSQERETARDFVTRESHYFMGKRYLLRVIDSESTPRVILKHDIIEMYVRPGSGIGKRKEILDTWYRQQLKELLPKYLAKWEKIIKVNVGEIGIKRMKTRWGTCNREAGRIWLNLEIANKPPECLEYILVHEMVHLLERRHNEIFVTYMDRFLPKWRAIREELNQLPIGHPAWEY